MRFLFLLIEVDTKQGRRHNNNNNNNNNLFALAPTEEFKMKEVAKNQNDQLKLKIRTTTK
jgi:hypothetical protein